MMQKILSLILAVLLLLSGCRETSPVPTDSPTEITDSPTEITEAPAEHTELYIPGLSCDDVIRYFGEVCLDAEFIHSGNPILLQKWASPIGYRIYGEPTPEDLAVLNGFLDWLNALEGFPGMEEVLEEHKVDLAIHFCSQEELVERMGDNFSSVDGAVTFWYDSSNVIYDAIICIRRDLPQALRNSVILEELYNCLGPIQDTSLREDSVIYAGYSEPQSLTQVDQLILQLLYHPSLTCGMTAEECETILRELYY